MGCIWEEESGRRIRAQGSVTWYEPPDDPVGLALSLPAITGPGECGIIERKKLYSYFSMCIKISNCRANLITQAKSTF